jgi:hypothetical protein
VTLLVMWEFLRGLFLENAPRKVLRGVLAGAFLLALVGISGPQEWVTAQLVDAAMDKANEIEQQIGPVITDYIKHVTAVSTPTPTPAP